MKETAKKSGWGGARPGSGPKTDAKRRNLLLRIREDVIERMSGEASKSRLIEELLIKHYKMDNK